MKTKKEKDKEEREEGSEGDKENIDPGGCLAVSK